MRVRYSKQEKLLLFTQYMLRTFSVYQFVVLWQKPKSVQLYNQIGNFWRIKGDAQKSIECFRRALAVSPHNAEVSYSLLLV